VRGDGREGEMKSFKICGKAVSRVAPLFCYCAEIMGEKLLRLGRGSGVLIWQGGSGFFVGWLVVFSSRPSRQGLGRAGYARGPGGKKGTL
jgi:hypothetical protein